MESITSIQSEAPQVTIIQTGAANIASVVVAMERLGASVKLTSDPDEIEAAQIVFLPGVGSFGNVMARIQSGGLAAVLKRRIEAERPLLAICLGMQILFEGSEESEGVAGIGALQGSFEKFPSDVMCPLLGWAEVSAPIGAALLAESGFAYFAHSYRLMSAPPGWQPAMTTHGTAYIAAIERGPMLLCQFHAELSGDWGERLLKRWLDKSVGMTS